jgi:hypothetical protein
LMKNRDPAPNLTQSQDTQVQQRLVSAFNPRGYICFRPRFYQFGDNICIEEKPAHSLISRPVSTSRLRSSVTRASGDSAKNLTRLFGWRTRLVSSANCSAGSPDKLGRLRCESNQAMKRESYFSSPLIDVCGDKNDYALWDLSRDGVDTVGSGVQIPSAYQFPFKNLHGFTFIVRHARLLHSRSGSGHKRSVQSNQATLCNDPMLDPYEQLRVETKSLWPSRNRRQKC